MTDNIRPIKRALISVSDKTGVIEFALGLISHNVEILSTGGTFKKLTEAGIAATEVSKHTGFPEIMDGRVKTLHPKIHGGILGRRDQDQSVMQEHEIDAIDLVAVNLYPFEATVAQPDCSLEDAVENIDIGGPTMVRAAAKNHRDVTIVVNSNDYPQILAELEAEGGTKHSTRFDLAIKAFEHTAKYDAAIANHFGQQVETGSEYFPRTINLQLMKKQELRYGENPHQNAAFYIETDSAEPSISNATQLQGKELSFNNIADTDAALETVKLFEEPSCVIVKHANPCGVASASNIESAYKSAFATDTESAFGGIIAFNRPLDAATAALICENQFVEVIIAPGVEDEAAQIVASKKNVRLLKCEQWQQSAPAMDYKRVNGGLLLQNKDLGMIDETSLKVVSERIPNSQEISDLLFTWKVAKMVKSNAIVYGRDKRTIGIGAGQMSRINSARIAAIKAEHAGLTVEGSCMASDAFFPFRDGIDNAAKAGISCVIQPGGSMRDEEVIAAANESGMAMVFTGMRHFRH